MGILRKNIERAQNSKNNFRIQKKGQRQMFYANNNSSRNNKAKCCIKIRNKYTSWSLNILFILLRILTKFSWIKFETNLLFWVLVRVLIRALDASPWPTEVVDLRAMRHRSVIHIYIHIYIKLHSEKEEKA